MKSNTNHFVKAAIYHLCTHLSAASVQYTVQYTEERNMTLVPIQILCQLANLYLHHSFLCFHLPDELFNCQLWCLCREVGTRISPMCVG